MTKKDFTAAIISGACIGICVALIAKSIGEIAGSFSESLGDWFFVILFIGCFGAVCLALAIGSFIGRKIPTIYELIKFAIVGGLNTLVDFGVLNLLMILSGVASGSLFTVFKGVSFCVAVANSYAWNKFWTFSSDEKTDASKVFRFFAVSVIGFGVNVSIASVIVNLITPFGGISEQLWANIGSVFATAASMVWNFVGYKLFVFKSEK